MNADRPGGTVIDGRVVAPDAYAGDTAPGDERRTEEDIATGVRGYLVGLVLATVLTVASFTVAGSQIVWGPALPVALIVLAIAQMGVHLVSSCTSRRRRTTRTTRSRSPLAC